MEDAPVTRVILHASGLWLYTALGHNNPPWRLYFSRGALQVAPNLARLFA